MIDYDTGKGIVATAFQLRSSIIPQVLKKSEFYILLGMNLSITYMRRTGVFHAEQDHIELSMKLTQVTGALMTFFVVFYNGNIFTRYLRLYELTKGMCENCLYIVSILSKEIKDRDMVRKMTRLLLASCFMFFFSCAKGTMSHEHLDAIVTNAEWEQLKNIGLLEAREVEHLKLHCSRLKHDAVPAFVLVHWSMKLYRTQVSRIPDLDKYYFSVRKCQEDVVEMMELPMPFQYFHIMNLMLMLNLMLWGYALALQESYFAPVIFLFVQLMFQGLREMSIALSDPFGDDDTDFPLNEWLTGLYLRLHDIVEHDFDMGDVKLYDNWPLLELQEGQCVVDLLVDIHKAPVKRPAAREMTIEQMKQISGGVQKEQRKSSKEVTSPGGTTKHTEEEEHHEEEEEDDE